MTNSIQKTWDEIKIGHFPKKKSETTHTGNFLNNFTQCLSKRDRFFSSFHDDDDVFSDTHIQYYKFTIIRMKL